MILFHGVCEFINWFQEMYREFILLSSIIQQQTETDIYQVEDNQLKILKLCQSV